MTRQYSYFKTQTPNSNDDYAQTISKGFNFVPSGSIVTKFTICAETNLKLLVSISNGEKTEIYLKQGTTWNLDNDDMYGLDSIVCDSVTARVTYMIGYRKR
ncbi:MAG: hypothetical protein ACRDD7_01395 [Peptostreptococcaceae bacterium]